ncbi:MAG: alkaline phosphatase family protein [Chryseolinea sp.]
MTRAFIIVTALCVVFSNSSHSQSHKTKNIVIVTLDGLRWQEVFGGCDSKLIGKSPNLTEEQIYKALVGGSSIESREKVMPFFWKTIGTQGQVYGNRTFGNYMNCSNPYWFSYPGYSEMLVGYVDKSVRSNQAVDNRNATVLEFINSRREFENRVGVFATWAVMSNIACKSLPKENVITGSLHSANELSKAKEYATASGGIFLTPENVGHDAVTFTRAFEFLKRERPRALLISFDETDEHAHGGRYAEYLKAAHNIDKMIESLWTWIQTDENYKDQTTLIITTDHGRGHNNKQSWKNHGRLAFGSDQIWIAVIGPDTESLGEMRNKQQYWQNQIAKTAAAFLNLDYSSSKPVGSVIQSMITHSIEIIGDPETTQRISSSTEPN